MKMKSELKVEFSNNKLLKKLIEVSYFKKNQNGKLSGQDNFIEITPEVDDVFHTMIKGLNNVTIKLTNPDLIDGTCRFILSEDGDSIKLYPISIFCVLDEHSRYSFY